MLVLSHDLVPQPMPPPLPPQVNPTIYAERKKNKRQKRVGTGDRRLWSQLGRQHKKRGTLLIYSLCGCEATKATDKPSLYVTVGYTLWGTHCLVVMIAVVYLAYLLIMDLHDRCSSYMITLCSFPLSILSSLSLSSILRSNCFYTLKSNTPGLKGVSRDHCVFFWR